MNPDDDDEPEKNEGPEDFDIVDSEQELGDPCPICRKIIYEDSDRCPNCGNYIVRRESRSSTQMWIILSVIAVLGTIIFFWIMS
jgi:hypothetical protein